MGFPGKVKETSKEINALFKAAQTTLIFVNAKPRFVNDGPYWNKTLLSPLQLYSYERERERARQCIVQMDCYGTLFGLIEYSCSWI